MSKTKGKAISSFPKNKENHTRKKERGKVISSWKGKKRKGISSGRD